ncbi:Aminoglycoside N(6')-acetyltransferase type 1 (fragment) [Xenorhabdus bovienii str. kraussei Becker Underwood]|uniref:Aminoglycoside N(6')-acetyltransferase type 1 n=1 Tax=Xenorhabdus bovienii str. kraussei Becker Underwood TaxID=1398204 RepID=A0A077PQ59_XENBV
MLISHACLWAKEHNCQEIASNTHISNLISQKLHHSLGFIETERVIFYKKMIL